jgi:hypothetical protein
MTRLDWDKAASRERAKRDAPHSPISQVPASPKQIAFLRTLGYGDYEGKGLSMRLASEYIKAALAKQSEQANRTSGPLA